MRNTDGQRRGGPHSVLAVWARGQWHVFSRGDMVVRWTERALSWLTFGMETPKTLYSTDPVRNCAARTHAERAYHDLRVPENLHKGVPHWGVVWGSEGTVVTRVDVGQST